MAATRKLSRRGAKFIAAFEGFSARPYRDSVGVLTQGYGHTGSGIGGVWTRFRARQQLRRDSKFVAVAIRRAYPHAHFNQHELDALISFGFNLGTGYFTGDHDMAHALHSGKRHRIAAAFLLYDVAGGQHLEGLSRRRHAEAHVFLNGYK